MKQKILIVDDDRIVIKGIKKLVDWEANGFEVVGEAYDGKAGLEFVKNNQVDIILTDIVMPVMDGIEMIKEINKSGIIVKLLILSSYSEFQYVRQAFLLGASEYILKTELNADRLLNACLKLGAEINIVKNTAAQIENSKKIVRDLMQINNEADSTNKEVEFSRKEKIYKELIFSRPMQEQVKIQNNEAFCGNGKLMLVYIDNYNETILDNWDSDHEALKFAVLFILDEIIISKELKNKVDIFGIIPQEYGIVINDDLDAQNLFDDIKSMLMEYIQIMASAGLSGSGILPQDYRKLYIEAVRAGCRRNIVGKGNLVKYYENYKEMKGDLEIVDRTDYLKSVLKTFDTEEITNLPNIICFDEFSVDVLTVPAVRGIYDKYALVISTFVDEYGIGEFCEGIIEKYYNNIWSTGTIRDYNEWFRKIFNAISQTFIKRSGKFTVGIALEYIKSNYAKDINLNCVAKHIGISEGYLRRLFFLETGSNFTGFINSYRIEKAKEYMVKSDMKLYEIAEKVGFNSFVHFNRTFRAIEGKSPKDYEMSLTSNLVK